MAVKRGTKRDSSDLDADTDDVQSGAISRLGGRLAELKHPGARSSIAEQRDYVARVLWAVMQFLMEPGLLLHVIAKFPVMALQKLIYALQDLDEHGRVDPLFVQVKRSGAPTSTIRNERRGIARRCFEYLRFQGHSETKARAAIASRLGVDGVTAKTIHADLGIARRNDSSRTRAVNVPPIRSDHEFSVYLDRLRDLFRQLPPSSVKRK